MNLESDYDVEEYIERVKVCSNTYDFLHWQLIEFTRMCGRISYYDKNASRNLRRVLKALSDKMHNIKFTEFELTTI